jgi:predicted transcriptional regulator
MVEKQSFMRAEDVAKELGISVSHAYKIMQQLNKELKARGYMTIAGRGNRKFFMEKFCYGGTEGK